MDADDGVGGHQLQARFDQQLFQERIADLDSGALFGAVVVEFGAGHGRAMDAVTAGFGADINHGIASALGGGGEDAVGGRDTNAHHIDQNVAVIASVEIGLPADGGHANAIAIAGDAADHAIDQAFGFGMGWIAKAQRVHQRDGAGAHGEHIAQDAADAGGRALVGLNEAWVVVAFHLEDAGQAFADVDRAGVFARPIDHVRRLGRQLGQMNAGGFVAAVLGPHDAKNAEFGDIGRAAELGEDRCPFFAGEAEGDRLILGGGLQMRVSHGAFISRPAGSVYRRAGGRCRRPRHPSGCDAQLLLNPDERTSIGDSF